MRKVKLTICLLFVAAATSVTLFRSAPVSGQGGGTSLDAPTGVIASDNQYVSKVEINWDTIRNATVYRIFRNTTNDPLTATSIGVSATNSFFDTAAPIGQAVFYWVRAENGSTVSSLGSPDQGTRSNATGGGGLQPLGPPPPPPPSNPITATKTSLGKVLFWDEQLSSTRTVACGTCHHANNGGTDPRSVALANLSLNPGLDGITGTADDVRGSAGVSDNNVDGSYISVANYGLNAQVTTRKTVSHINAAFSPNSLFWDGRATGVFRDPITNSIVLNGGGALESQVLAPPVSSSEMGHNGRDWNDVATRITGAKPLVLSANVPAALTTWISGRTYPELFDEAFGSPEVTPSRIAMAIATYERTLYTDRSPFDLDAQGITLLSPAAQRGRGTFNNGATGCTACHAGNIFSDGDFHNIGVRPANEDTGRFQVTGNIQDRGLFRTPDLRNVGLRHSFFHNGQITTLNDVVAFYNRGGDFHEANQDPRLHPLGLGQNALNDLVAFLTSLTDPRLANETGQFQRPSLYTESARVPVVTGTGRAGSGAIVPQIKAISPPLAGNPNFTVSVASALGSASAVLVIDSTDPGTGATIPTTGNFARIETNTQNSGAGNGWASLSLPVPNTTNVVGHTFFARWYIQDAAAVNGFSVSQAAQFTVFGDPVAAPTRAQYVDFDGDGKTDVSVFRPSSGNWYVFRSSDSVVTTDQFGIATDALTPSDFDGDGKTDMAVFRDGTWFIQKTHDGFAVIPFGQAGDIAQPGDYDGDGIADVAVYRPSSGVWFIQQSRDGFAAIQFGISTDKPVSADFDGDGKTDEAVYRDGIWYVNKSTAGFYAVQFGLPDDKPVMGDYDGDGKADLAVWRPSTGVWFILHSTNDSVSGGGFGLSSDVPTPGDFDGNGSNDFAVFRPSGGNWFILDPTSGAFRAQQFGAAGDKPVPSAIVP